MPNAVKMTKPGGPEKRAGTNKKIPKTAFTRGRWVQTHGKGLIFQISMNI